MHETGTRCQGLSSGRGKQSEVILIRDLIAVGLFDNCGQCAFLSIAAALLIRLISQHVVFIHPGYRSSIHFGHLLHAPRCRRSSAHYIIIISCHCFTWFPVRVQYTHRPCRPLPLASTTSWVFLCLAWIPRYFHASCFRETPRSFKSKSPAPPGSHQGNFRTRIHFCSGLATGAGSS